VVAVRPAVVAVRASQVNAYRARTSRTVKPQRYNPKKVITPAGWTKATKVAPRGHALGRRPSASANCCHSHRALRPSLLRHHRWTSQLGTDEHNPDPSKRDRPIVGTQLLLRTKPAGGQQ
jgi:hypothetical protein